MEPLLVIREGAEAGREMRIEDAITLGRADECDLVLADQGVSRSHARVASSADGAMIEDLGSSNGTFVNGRSVEGAQALRDGDEITLGGAVIQFVGGSGETQVMGDEVDPDATEAHPPPAAGAPGAAEPRAATPPPREPIPVPPPRPSAEPPRREPILQPEPAAPVQRDAVNDFNLPALAAVVLGPLSILLLIFSSGSGFYAALPVAITAVALGTIGRNKVDRGESWRYRSFASAGRTLGIIGTILAGVVLIAVIIVTQILDVSAESIGELADEIRQEIESP